MNPWKILSDAEVEAIHQATLRLLSEVGIVLDSPETRSILQAAGATVKGDRVCLPPEMVEQAIQSAGKTITTRGRNGQSITLGDGSLHWHNLGGARDVFDPQTGMVRHATIQDVIDSTRLLDALDQATTVTPFFTPVDVPGALMSLAMYRHALPHTTKPLQGPGVQTPAEVRIAVDLAAVIGPPAEILTMSVSPVSPLIFPGDLADSMVEIARQGIPFGPLPCPTAGTTAPMSLAGALAQQNAEVLAAIVIVQLVNPGLPIIYCGRLAMMEPRTGSSVWGGVEMGMASAATVQIGHYYGLPVNVYGLSTNSHTLEIQNGYERALNALMPALAGADELSGIGEMAAGVAGSYAQMVCDNDIAASVRRIRRGFRVDQDSLAVDVVAEIMEGSRNFMAQAHTVKYLRAGELFHRTLGVRQGFEAWNLSGRESLAEKAQAEAERLIATHEVLPLAADQEKELDQIMAAAGKTLAAG